MRPGIDEKCTSVHPLHIGCELESNHMGLHTAYKAFGDSRVLTMVQWMRAEE